jgi:hypothetical protein
MEVQGIKGGKSEFFKTCFWMQIFALKVYLALKVNVLNYKLYRFFYLFPKISYFKPAENRHFLYELQSKNPPQL